MGPLVAGCSAEEQQASTELPSASSTPAEPTPELPPLGPADFPVPDEARVQDKAGAEAFLRYFVAMLNRQQSATDGEPIRRLAPDCPDCLAIARRFDEAAADGLTLKGGEISIDGEVGTSFRGDSVEFSFVTDVAPAQAFDSDGDPIPEYAYAARDDLSSGLGLAWDQEQQYWSPVGLTIG